MLKKDVRRRLTKKEVLEKYKLSTPVYIQRLVELDSINNQLR
ncbi:hypothetical protein VAE122_2740002 [Vibrio aestuarianus]|nr:hypothetical protein VAE122_2740002 [Vibrio aestuarianus]